MSMLSATLLIFLVMDPLGNIPHFLCNLKHVEPKRHRGIILRELFAALIVLVIFLFAGQHLLRLLGVSQSSLGIAGGIILFLIAIKMIFSGAENIFESTSGDAPFIVPLAIPLIAGPSAMATVILIMAGDPSRWLEWLGALGCAWVATGFILLLSSRLIKILGNKGLMAVERLMGMILTTVAVEMLITGIRKSFFS